MSLIQRVIDLLEEHGPCSGVDLRPHLPDHTQEQIFQALQNAKYEGWIVLIDRGRALGHGKGKMPGTWDLSPTGRARLCPRPVLQNIGERPVSSVWEMGERAGVQA
jgi:hypothetical protein